MVAFLPHIIVIFVTYNITYQFNDQYHVVSNLKKAIVALHLYISLVNIYYTVYIG